LANLGFLGLGIMGYRMARHLLRAGHDVALWSHTPGKAEKLAQEGKGTPCATPRDVAARSEVIFYCVGDTAMAEEITLGPNGLIETARPGALIADCSSIAPEASVRIARAFAAKGVDFLDSPVTGSTGGAEKATLTFMVGGDKAVFERARPYMEIMGKLFYYCGPPGYGLRAKVVQNMVGAGILQAFCEGLILAARAGIQPELMIDIIENSAARSGLASFKAPFILNRDFTPHFSAKWMHKDVGFALEMARSLGIPVPQSAVTEQMLRAAVSKGWGDDDFCSAIRVLEDWTGMVIGRTADQAPASSAS
jgi:3-hydroxyisobutyrate dehydrogenase-like beta-hydroxyacid dehydrogenase